MLSKYKERPGIIEGRKDERSEDVRGGRRAKRSEAPRLAVYLRGIMRFVHRLDTSVYWESAFLGCYFRRLLSPLPLRALLEERVSFTNLPERV